MKNNDALNIGVIGMSEGNGHPYSWSAIFNGYNADVMKTCPFSVIPEYLSKQKFPEDCIPHGRVTHIWTQDKNLSLHIARSSHIKNVVSHYEEMIGKVDAILLARDDAENHLEMSLPFIKAGLPIFIDKPITLSLKALEILFEHEQYPGQIYSCSALRYANELKLSSIERESLGPLDSVEAVTPKSWERYGIHIVEPVLFLLNIPSETLNITSVVSENDVRRVSAQWGGVSLKFSALGNIVTPVKIILNFRNGVSKELIFKDAFSAFKASLECFIEGINRQKRMISFDEMRSYISLIERGLK